MNLIYMIKCTQLDIKIIFCDTSAPTWEGIESIRYTIHQSHK